MKTVNEVSKLTGISVRTLHYYDTIGLLSPAQVTESGYRLYGTSELERLSQILLFRELEFPLKEISRILDSPNFDKSKALEQQIQLLTLQKEHLEGLICYAEQLQRKGGKVMSFDAFDKRKMEEYAAQAKKNWGTTEEYKEYEKKSDGRTPETQKSINDGLMEIFEAFGQIRTTAPDGEQARALVEKLQQYISDNYYTCKIEILKGLGQMYAAGGEMTDNIDRAGGVGTAVFAAKAIELF